MRPKNLKNFSRRFSVSPERRLVSRPRRNQLQCDTIIDQTVTEGAELRVETSSERFCLPIQSWTLNRLSHILTSRKSALTSRHLQSKRPNMPQHATKTSLELFFLTSNRYVDLGEQLHARTCPPVGIDILRQQCNDSSLLHIVWWMHLCTAEILSGTLMCSSSQVWGKHGANYAGSTASCICLHTTYHIDNSSTENS